MQESSNFLELPWFQLPWDEKQVESDSSSTLLLIYLCYYSFHVSGWFPAFCFCSRQCG